MIGTLRQRNFALLWAGGLLSSIGDYALFIALPFYTYRLIGSALATGGMFIAQALPALLLGSVAGVFADRWNRKHTMVIGDLLRAVILLPLLLVRTAESAWIIYMVAFAESAVGQFFNPARGALLPRLVAEQHLLAANSLNGMSRQLTGLIGPPLGGALLAVLGFGSLTLLDAGSYLASALLIALIAAPRSATAAPPANARPRGLAVWASVWHELIEGLRIVRHEPQVSALFIVAGITTIGQGIIGVLLVPFINDVLHSDAQGFAWIVSAQSIGGITGGFLITSVSRAISPARMVPLSLLAHGMLFLLFVHAPSYLFALGAIAFSGVTVMSYGVTIDTLLQRGVADQYRGRILGAFGTSQWTMMLLGMVLGSGLGAWLGVLHAWDIVVGLIALGGVCGLILLRDSGSIGPIVPEGAQ